MIIKNNKNSGYIALITVLVVTVLVIVIGTSTSLLSINDLQNSFAFKKNEETIDLTEGCVEDALIRLNRNGSIPSTLTLPEGVCSVTINSQVGDNWDFTVANTSGDFIKKIRIIADRSATVSVSSWIEVE